MFVDLPLAELRAYSPDVAEPQDFDEFWTSELTRAREAAPLISLDRLDSPIRFADVYDVTFAGHDGAPIRAWLLMPHETADVSPVVVEYIGYGGGRGTPFDWMTYSTAGYPHLVMDTRGQGSGWQSGDTPDTGGDGAPATPGYMSRGIGSPRTYYYTRLMIDAARALDAAAAIDVLAGRRLVTAGRSQGGALSLAAAHLHGSVAATMPSVPFLSDFRRALRITDSAPYGELVRYLSVHRNRSEQMFDTLSYIDVVNHAKRIAAPGLFAVGLVDDITPASTVFAAYNSYAGDKNISVYEFNGHEGGQSDHLMAQLDFLASL